MKTRSHIRSVRPQFGRSASRALPHPWMRRALGPALVMLVWDQVAQGQTVQFDYTGAFQTWTIPSTGVYTITAYGAQGGDAEFGEYFSYASNGRGGLGAKVSGEFNLIAGQVLSIAVGGQGGQGWYGAGGGGGTFVMLSSLPLLIAGGGGGGSYSTEASGGAIGSSGQDGGSGAYYGIGGLGGTGGFGGGGGDGGGQSWGYSGGGGGGFYGNGANGAGTGGGSGGFGFYAGLGGGAGPNGAIGGFGGGGGGYGGGGGGFSGGGGGGNYDGGGGGGSFNAGLNPDNAANVRSGNGVVYFTLIPEPTAFGLAGLGFAVLMVRVARRERRRPVGVEGSRVGGFTHT